MQTLSTEPCRVALPAAPTLQRETRREAGESSGQSQVPGRGGRRRNSGGHSKTASGGKQCVPSRKQTPARANSDACRIRLSAAPGGRGRGNGLQGRAGPPPGGASPVWPGGSVAACLGSGGSPRRSGGSSKGTAILQMGRREEEGDLFKLGGWASEKKRRKRRNRLMLCRTPRVFLSVGITSTFRQEQELGGKQQHGLTARR